MAESIPCGPDAGPILESVDQAIEAGDDHVYFHQIGPDQEGFIEFWKKELEPSWHRARAPLDGRRPGHNRRSSAQGSSSSCRLDAIYGDGIGLCPAGAQPQIVDVPVGVGILDELGQFSHNLLRPSTARTIASSSSTGVNGTDQSIGR